MIEKIVNQAGIPEGDDISEEKSSEKFPMPEGYDGWTSAEEVFKREAWDKFALFEQRIRSAGSISAIISAVEQYAVTDTSGKEVVVEWFSFGERPSYDFAESLEKVINVLMDIEKNGVENYLGPEKNHVRVKGISLIQWRIEELFNIVPPTEDKLVLKMKTHADRLRAHLVDEEVPLGERRIRLKNFYHDVEKIHTTGLFKEYSSGAIPSVGVLRDSAMKVADAIAKEIERERKSGVSDEDLDREIALERILRGRGRAIDSGIRSYIATVLRFQNLSKRRSEGRDLLKQFESADHQRRQSHNSLISSLRIFAKAVEEAKSLGVLDGTSVVPWQLGMNMNEFKGQDKVTIFSERTLNDRDFIRDWAIVAELYERLQEIDELEKKKSDKG